ncbi:AfsR/SARP family transcriptional regulator [Streptomyces acidiscabies]|uniref:AfsR/SARP family transcriptional regulator n=1 Tax=Streptomyces acidiscabies TaxID=42234 RepID=UPI00076EDB4D|nr:AfsR/SARP family transcriptional regulator [Streptomyces acidiscabies]GAQ57553.1 transcriptional regulatory protein EmbR [Streptomyces acidiscabies]
MHTETRDRELRRDTTTEGTGARRIAELEHEVRELRRANETLKQYVSKALDLDTGPRGEERAGVRAAGSDLDVDRAGGRSAGSGRDLDADRSGVRSAGRDLYVDRPGVQSSGRDPDGDRPGMRSAGRDLDLYADRSGTRFSGRDPDRSGGPDPERPSRRPAPATGVEFRVLGPVEAAVDGRWVDLGAPKQRAALVLLVSQVGQPVSVDALVDALWEGRPPQSAITSLHAYIANLRRALEPHRAPRTPATVLCTRGRGYLLDSRAVEVDAHRFWEHATAGWQALDRGDPQRALYAFEAGLGLWRGEAYAEVAGAPHVAPEAVRLEELRLSVVEGRCATLIAVGNHEMAVPELVAFTQAHPLREYGCELLTLALYRSGRQADALSVLRAHQKKMVEGLGISPSPALQHLELEILRQAPELERS